MPIYLSDVENRRYSLSGAIPYDEKDFPAAFPFTNWNYQQQKYYEYWQYFTGEVWNETVPDEVDPNGPATLRYPLQINYIKSACLKHNYILWGEASENPGPMVPIRVKPRTDDDELPLNDDDKKRCRQLENFINYVWEENNGRILEYEGGLVSQFLGGTVFRIGYAPDNDDLEFKIRLELILPDFFMPVWDSTNPDNLLEAFIVWRVPSREAHLRFGYPEGDGSTDPIYLEHWTKNKVNISLGGQPIVYKVLEEELDYNNADNPFGFVPFQYIPRERVSFYGLSLVDDLKGLSKEMNARLADFGDAIKESVHREIYTKNMTGAGKEIDLGNRRKAINLGNNNPATGAEPDIIPLEPAQISDNLAKYPDTLHDQFLRDAAIPKVAEGEDEGSQRSALTLAFRMWPMTAMIRAQRNRWTAAKISMAKKIARIAIIKGIGGITEEHLKNISFSCEWPTMIPRDREQLVNEMVLAIQTNMISPIEANQKLNLTTDPYESYQMVQEHVEWLNKAEALAKPAPGSTPDTQIQSPVASTGAETEKS